MGMARASAESLITYHPSLITPLVRKVGRRNRALPVRREVDLPFRHRYRRRRRQQGHQPVAQLRVGKLQQAAALIVLEQGQARTVRERAEAGQSDRPAVFLVE